METAMEMPLELKIILLSLCIVLFGLTIFIDRVLRWMATGVKYLIKLVKFGGGHG